MMITEKKELCINKQNKNVTSFKRFDGGRSARATEFYQFFSNAPKNASKNAARGKVFFF